MAIQDSLRSESDSENEEEQEEERESSEKSISEERGDGDEHEDEEPESTSGDVNGKQGISEYEKQRLRRIAENKARMEALGLRKMASSLMGSVQKLGRAPRASQRRGKRKDEDYTPNDNHGDGLDDDVDDDDLDDEDFVSSKSYSKPSKNKVKNKGSNHKKKVPNLKNFSSEDYLAEDNNELMHAIALSLNDCVKNSTVEETKGSSRIQEDTRRIKRKKSVCYRIGW
uniref:Uncharacterized protein LOC105132013 isoform X2 n=1 Tax=Rhizophora mucronata TaxID=61149 RepID=A0A2P2JBR4_RHIMU